MRNGVARLEDATYPHSLEQICSYLPASLMSSMEECSVSLKVIKGRFHDVFVAASLRSSVCSGEHGALDRHLVLNENQSTSAR